VLEASLCRADSKSGGSGPVRSARPFLCLEGRPSGSLVIWTVREEELRRTPGGCRGGASRRPWAPQGSTAHPHGRGEHGTKYRESFEIVSVGLCSLLAELERLLLRMSSARALARLSRASLCLYKKSKISSTV
jgi:hypothetical protein